MEEKNYNINWLSLFIKVTVFVVVVLLAIWLVAKLVRKDKGLTFEENNKLFKNATIEYFSRNLPESGKSTTVTLKQLMSWDYLNKLKNKDGKVCDINNSKSKIEQIETYYSIKTDLICGDQSETSYIKLGNENCEACDVNIEGLEIPEVQNQEEQPNDIEEQETDGGSKGNVPTTGANDNIESTDSTNDFILYEYVKEVANYSNWYTGKVTGDNIENSTKKISYSKYCKKNNLNNCITDKTENSNNYSGYKIVDTWDKTIDIYRYRITVSEYKYSNLPSLDGYTKTGKTKIAD